MNFNEEKLGRLLFKFALPCVISMLVNSVYNIVDQIFIGQAVGYLGNAATTVIYPLIITATAVCLMLGDGAAASFNLKLGEGRQDEAKATIGTVLFFY